MKNYPMFSILFHWIVFIIIVYSTSAQQSNRDGNSFYMGTPSIPVHNDTTRDQDGINIDTEPIGNNGRGSHEANSQNYAAENNGIHGMLIDEFQKSILEQHNFYRRQMCAKDLVTSDSLHREAEERVHIMANEKNPSPLIDYNINIYEEDTGDPSRTTPQMIVQTWFNQWQKYNASNEFSATSFTQLIWKQSNEIGVAHAYNGQKLYVIVLYRPPGNIPGQFAINVGCPSNNKANR